MRRLFSRLTNEQTYRILLALIVAVVVLAITIGPTGLGEIIAVLSNWGQS